MQTSATDLVRVLTSVEQIAVSSLTDDEKILVLDDINRCIPPEQFCIQCLKTRAIVINKIQRGYKWVQRHASQEPKAPAK